MKPEFVHLHNHSDLSLLDGACRIDDLVRKTDALGMRATALTDHGNLFGAVEFYQRALQRGVKPIIGIEAYVAPGDRRDRRDSKGVRDSSYHLTLLARNEAGYRNLLKLSTIAYQEGFYYRPRMDKEILQRHHEGIIGLSGCPSSEFSTGCRFDHLDRAFATADEYAQIFGKDHFFLEVQNHGLQDETRIIRGAIEASKKLGLGIVATNDVHYLSKDDHRAQDVLMAIRVGKPVVDPDRPRLPTPEFYLKSPEEMAQTFRDMPEALANTLRIAEQCNLELHFDEIHLPPFPLPEGYERPDDYLRALCEEGVVKRYGEVTQAVRERLDLELGVIAQMGFASYFLIVWDIRRYARDNGIRVGPGRGSAAGSLVSYVLRITNIDPLRYGLIFERFLNPGRREMPDIDVDFSNEDRPRVIQYLRDRYGHDNVAQIITFGKMKARAVLRDVGRVLGMEFKDVDPIAKKIPGIVNITLNQAREMEPELAQMIEANPQVRELWEIGLRLEGLCRHASKHASGIVMA
ncbi:MAG: DNA polymerase III subunit alpha, partial [Planctomycetota bacterium]